MPRGFAGITMVAIWGFLAIALFGGAAMGDSPAAVESGQPVPPSEARAASSTPRPGAVSSTPRPGAVSATTPFAEVSATTLPGAVSATTPFAEASATPPPEDAAILLPPVNVLTALDDALYERAEVLLEPLLSRHPNHPGLRMIRLWLEAERDPDRFIALDPPLLVDEGAPWVDRFESCFSHILRLYCSRELYRGDRDEDAATFIARLEGRAGEIRAALASMDSEVAAVPWAGLARGLLDQLTHRQTEAGKVALWELLDAAGAWRDYLKVLAIEHRLVPASAASDWLVARLEGTFEAKNDPKPGSKLGSGLEPAVGTGDPFAARMFLAQINLAVEAKSTQEALGYFREVLSRFPDGAYRDDVELAFGTLLANSFSREHRLQAITLLSPLVKPPFRNTTFQATMELGALFRRLDRYDDAIALFQQFQHDFPAYPYRFDRELGRAYYHKKQYEVAVAAFRRSAEGLRGGGKDYLFMATSMRFLPDLYPERYDRAAVRKEALKLSDFASAAQREEKRVAGWTNGLPRQIVELQCRFVELVAFSRHVLLFPLTFLSIGMMALTELLAFALGLIAFVSFPRLARLTWRSLLVISVGSLALPGVALWRGVPESLGGAGDVVWLVQSAGRLFFMLAGTMALSPVVGLQGLAFFRRLRRARFRHKMGSWLRASRPLLIGVLVLVGLDVASRVYGLAPTSYLARLPTLLSGAELGSPPGELLGVSRWSLLAFNVLHTEVLARGLLLTVVLFLVRERPHAPLLAVVLSAMLWSVLTMGVMEPSPVYFAKCLGEGTLLGGIRLRHGVDGAVFVHIAATIVTLGIS